MILSESPARRCPACRFALLLALECLVIALLGRGQYAGLDQRGSIGPALLQLHKATQFLTALGAVVLLSGLLAEGSRRAIWQAPRPGWLPAAQILAFTALAGTYLARRAGLDGTVPDLLSVALPPLCAAGGFLLLMPWPALDPARRTLLLAGSGLMLAWGIVAPAATLPLRLVQGWVEGLTLRISLHVLDLMQVAPISVLRGAAGEPVLAAKGFAISIAASCAGYEGVASAAFLILLYAATERHRLKRWPAALLAALACGTVFVVNGLRIALLFALGVHGHAELALNGFHSHFGVVGLLAVVAGTVALLHLPFFQRNAPAATPPRAPAALARSVAPLALTIAAALLTGLVSGGFDWLYPLHAVLGAALLWRERAWLASRLGRIGWHRALPVGALVYLLWVLLVPDDPGRSAAMRTALAAEPAEVALPWLAFRILGAALVVPILEELAFRGGIQPALAGLFAQRGPPTLAPWLATAVAALGFGLMHQNALAGTVAGLAYGLLTLRGARLGDAILAHACTNALLAAHVLTTGQFSYW